MAGAFVRALRDERVRLLLRLNRLLRPFYRLSFLAGGARHSVFAALAAGPKTAEALAEELGVAADHIDALRSWLDVGCRLGDVRRERREYSLRSRTAQKLAAPECDGAAAFLVEIATLHHMLLLETPGRLAQGRPYTLADQDGELIARSSRTVEPFITSALERVVSPTGATRLLEVGCGSGIYIRRAAEMNPSLTAVGLELQPEVAEQARENLRGWGLEDRAEIEVGDVRDRDPEPVFDVVTLHNNIYYFPVDDRPALLEHLGKFLVPGGTLLLTTGCKGGNLGFELLDLWATATEGCGPLPRPGELVDQLRAAGLEPEPPRRLIPADAFYGFVATKR